MKVGDFGLSRDLTEENYYTSNDKEAKLPIKWMALESMERRVYNTKTDVVCTLKFSSETSEKRLKTMFFEN